MAQPAKRRGYSLGAALREGLLQVDTAARGATNTLTFGAANPTSAALNAVPALWQPGSYAERLRRNLEQEAARDRYDAIHRPGAKFAGEMAGLLMGLGKIGAMGKAQMAAKPARVKDLSFGPAAKLPAFIAGNAVSGTAAQGTADIMTGKQSPWQSYASSGAGAALSAPVTKFVGPTIGGAVDGAASSVINSLLLGRPISTSDATQDALAGGAGGRFGELLGTLTSRNMTATQKGALGEMLSVAHSPFLGVVPFSSQKNFAVSGGKTRADQAVFSPVRFFTGREAVLPVEAKMGYGPNTSTRQREAIEEIPGYRIDHIVPEDVGKIVGAIGGTLGAQTPNGLAVYSVPAVPNPKESEETFRRLGLIR